MARRKAKKATRRSAKTKVVTAAAAGDEPVPSRKDSAGSSNKQTSLKDPPPPAAPSAVAKPADEEVAIKRPVIPDFMKDGSDTSSGSSESKEQSGCETKKRRGKREKHTEPESKDQDDLEDSASSESKEQDDLEDSASSEESVKYLRTSGRKKTETAFFHKEEQYLARAFTAVKKSQRSGGNKVEDSEDDNEDEDEEEEDDGTGKDTTAPAVAKENKPTKRTAGDEERRKYMMQKLKEQMKLKKEAEKKQRELEEQIAQEFGGKKKKSRASVRKPVAKGRTNLKYLRKKKDPKYFYRRNLNPEDFLEDDSDGVPTGDDDSAYGSGGDETATDYENNTTPVKRKGKPKGGSAKKDGGKEKPKKTKKAGKKSADANTKTRAPRDEVKDGKERQKLTARAPLNPVPNEVCTAVTESRLLEQRLVACKGENPNADMWPTNEDWNYGHEKWTGDLPVGVKPRRFNDLKGAGTRKVFDRQMKGVNGFLTMQTPPDNGEKDRPLFAAGIIWVDQVIPNPPHNPGRGTLDYANKFRPSTRIILQAPTRYAATVIAQSLQLHKEDQWSHVNDSHLQTQQTLHEASGKLISCKTDDTYMLLYGTRVVQEKPRPKKDASASAAAVEATEVQGDDGKEKEDGIASKDASASVEELGASKESAPKETAELNQKKRGHGEIIEEENTAVENTCVLEVESSARKKRKVTTKNGVEIVQDDENSELQMAQL